MDNLINNMAKSMAQELLDELKGEVPDKLKKLLEIEKKAELEKYCKDLLITQEDFVLLVYNTNTISYSYQRKFHNFVPEHLRTTDEELDALSSIKSGEKITELAKKFVNKISQTFAQRRYLVAHIFYNQQKWHLFYFDQRDFEDNHWKEGAHIHFVNYLWPNYNINDIWKSFEQRNASIGGKLHIRFKPIKNE